MPLDSLERGDTSRKGEIRRLTEVVDLQRALFDGNIERRRRHCATTFRPRARNKQRKRERDAILSSP